MKNHRNPSNCRQKSRFRNFQLESPLELDWGPFGNPFWEPFGLQHGFQRTQDGSKTTLGVSKTPLIRFQCRPSTSQDTSKTAQDAPKALQEPPRRLCKPPRALQGRFLRPQAAPRSSVEEPSKPPTLALQPLASGLQVASAGCAKR